MNNEVTRTAAQVAADINAVKSHASAIYRAALDVGKRSCIEIGRLLLEAKGLVPHGEWGKWLAENVDYSESTANNLMRCFKEFGDEQIDLFTGVSDADFFSVLNQSQMLEVIALPKERRRDFVEAHREEIESGEMSTRKMREEIAFLKGQYEQANEVIKEQREVIKNKDEAYENIFEIARQKTLELEALKNAPSPEPMVQEVIVHSPSDEDIEKIRAAEEERLRTEFEAKQAETVKDYERKLTAAEKEKTKIVKEASEKAKDAGDLHEKLKKIEVDHKAAMDKLKAEHEKKIAELEASYKKQAKASVAGTDPNVVRIRVAFDDFIRTFKTISGTLAKMKAEGGEQEQKADKLRANVEKILGGLIAEAGWTV